MKTSYLATLLATSWALPQTIHAPEEFAAVRDFLAERIAAGAAPSVAVAVVRDGETVWAEGFGHAVLEPRRAATPDTLYLLASVSKPMLATGLMVLVDRGRIELDRPVNDYLPGPKVRCYAGDPDDVTLRRLANHTSGMPVHWAFYYDVPPPPRDVTIARHAFVHREPGTAWEYCNLGFGILDYVVELRSGMPCGRFLEQAVYDPAGMHGTSDRVRPGLEPLASEQYARAAGGGFTLVFPYGFDHDGASAMWSSAHDLARFLRLHLGGGAIDGVRVLSRASAAEMQRVTGKRNDESGVGVAWFRERYHGRDSFSHGGGMPGVSTHIRAFPELGHGLVVLTNGDDSAFTSRCVERIAEVLLPAPASAPHEPASGPEPQTDGDRSAYAGRWAGRLHHWQGDLPVVLDVGEADGVRVTFGSDPARTVSDVRVAVGALHGRLRGVRLPVQRGYHGLVELQLRLWRDGARLRGIASAVAAGYFCVSHYVELDRAGGDR